MRIPRTLLSLAAIAAVTACTGAPDLADADGGLQVLVTAKEPQEAWLSNLGRSRLVLDDNGCLRHGEAFVIWSAGTRISRAADGRIQIEDGANGRAVHVGEEIGMSGVEGSATPEAARSAQPIPQACAGRAVQVGRLGDAAGRAASA